MVGLQIIPLLMDTADKSEAILRSLFYQQSIMLDECANQAVTSWRKSNEPQQNGVPTIEFLLNYCNDMLIAALECAMTLHNFAKQLVDTPAPPDEG